MGSEGVEFDFDSVEQGTFISYSRCQFVHRFEHLDDSGKVAVGKDKAEVTRSSLLQGGLYDTPLDTGGCGTVTSHQVSQIRDERDFLELVEDAIGTNENTVGE